VSGTSGLNDRDAKPVCRNPEENQKDLGKAAKINRQLNRGGVSWVKEGNDAQLGLAVVGERAV